MLLKNYKSGSQGNIIIIAVNLVVFLLSLSMPLTLFSYGFSQKIFYIASYLSVVLFFVTLANKHARTSIDKYTWLLFIAIFALGLVRLGWALDIRANYTDFTGPTANIISNYLLGGKRLLLGAFIISVISIHHQKITPAMVGCSKIFLWLGALATLGFGVHEYLLTGDRIKLTADAASSSSYMVLFLYCAYLWLSAKDVSRLWIVIDLAFVAIIFSLVILTGTRVSLLAFLFITLCQISRFYGLLTVLKSKRNRVITLILVAGLVMSTGERWMQAFNNIENYSNDSSTSVGARVAIWDSGLHFLPEHLGFSSPDVRTVTARAYIAAFHPGNTEGYTNVKYNMHNEFLEVVTLEGIVGLVSLVFLYVATFWIWSKRSALLGISLPVAALFIMGLTDSVLIYPQTTTLFVIALALCAIRPKLPQS